MNTQNPVPRFIKIALIISGLALATGTLYAQWSPPPPGTAPTCPTGTPGCDVPINVGGITQIKDGNLTVGLVSYPIGFWVYSGDSYLNNSSIGNSGSGYQEMGYNVGFTTTNDTYAYRVSDTAADIRFGESGGDIVFRTAPAGTAGNPLTLTERMRIDGPTGTVNIGGNLVVGGTATATAFCITGGSCITGAINGAGTLNYVPKWTPNGTTLGNSTIYEDASASRLVGVGTAVPTEKFSVEGNVAIGNLDTSSYGLQFRTRSDEGIFDSGYGLQIMAPERVVVSIDSNNNNVNASFTVVNNTSTNYGATATPLPAGVLFTVQEGGNVGIGTASPGFTLDVHNSAFNAGINVDSRYVLGSWDVIRNPASGIIAFGGVTGSQWTNTAIYSAGSERIRVDNSGNVGIGIPGPLQKFHVAAGDINVDSGQGFRINNTATAGQYLRGDGTRFVSSAIQAGDLPLTVVTGSGVATRVAFWSGANTLSSDANFLWDPANGGRLGIGTIAPGYLIDAQKTTAALTDTVMMRLANNNATRRWTGLRLDRNALAERWFIGMDDATDNLLFRRTGTTNDMVIDATGNVGVGTASPDARLDVNGQIVGGFGAVTTGGVLDWNDISNIRSGNGYTLLYGNAANGPGPGTYFHSLNLEYSSKDGSGNMTQMAIPYSAAGHINQGLYVRGRYSGVWSAWYPVGRDNLGNHTATQNILLNNNWLSNDGGNEGIRVDNSGNVGIGTLSPAWKLDVNGDIMSSGLNTWGFHTPDDGRTTLYFGRGANATITEWPIWFNAGGGAYFNGNVGIGISPPAQRLDVVGNVNVSAGNCYMINNVCVLSGTAVAGSGVATRVAFWSGANTLSSNANFYWDDVNGRLGVGAGTPIYKLDVENSGGWKARFGGPDGYIDMGPANAGWAHIYTDRPNFIFNQNVWSIPGGFSSYNTADLSLQTNGTTRLTILNANGNVGIGTAGPSGKFEVNDIGGMSTPSVKFGLSGTGGKNFVLKAQGTADLNFGTYPGAWTPALQIQNNDNSRYVWISPLDNALGSGNARLVTSGSDFDIRAGNTLSATFSTAGNVGIGMTPTTYKLEVNGTIWAGAYIYSSSDIRLKENIHTLPNALDNVLKLHGVSFDWKKDGTSGVGLIAQEVERVYPELVSTGADGVKSVAYGNLVGPLVEAVRDLKAENDDLRARVERLEQGN